MDLKQSVFRSVTKLSAPTSSFHVDNLSDNLLTMWTNIKYYSTSSFSIIIIILYYFTNEIVTVGYTGWFSQSVTKANF